MGTVYNTNVVTDGLVACWDAANRRSYPGTGTTWTDLAGGNDGALTNSPTFSADNLGSISLDGSDDHIVLDTTISLTDFTAQATFKVTAYGEEWGMFFGNTDNNNFIATWITNLLRVQDKNSTNSDLTYSGGLPTNEIIILQVTQSGNTNTWYVNGENVGTSSNGSYAGIDITTMAFYETGSGLGIWAGEYYNAQLYNRALTAEEVLQNYNATKRKFIGTESDSLVSRYDAADKRSYPSPSVYGIARWEDIQSFVYYGTLTNGAALAADKRSIAFDGTNDYVAVGEYVAQNLSELSVAVWVKPAAGNALYDGVCGRTGASSWATGWGLSYHDSNTFNFFGGHYSINNAQTDFTVNEWNLAVGTVSSSAVQLYVNGVSGTTSAPGTVAMTSTNFLIGAISSSYEGEQDIASVIIYNRALTADEVVAMYHREKKHYL